LIDYYHDLLHYDHNMIILEDMSDHLDRPGKTESRTKEARFLHRSVSEKLLQQLKLGQLAGGAKLPTLKDLAGEMAVSTMTVRRALRTLEREGHIYNIAGVGAFVRPPPPNQTGLRQIAIVGSDLTGAFQMAVARGAQRACQQTGRVVQLLDAHWDMALESANIRRLPDLGVQGALVLPPFSDPRSSEALQSLVATGFPMVAMDMAAPGIKLDLVASDHEAGAHLGASHLISQGYHRVVMLTHPPIHSSVAARISGYERALRTAGIEPLPEWKAFIDLKVHEAGYREGRKWWGGCRAILPLLHRLLPPLAILAIDAYAAWGVYEACRELRLRIPEDVSVMAFDDIEITHVVTPPMTIIAQRTDVIGREAVALLERKMKAQSTPREGCTELTQILIDVDLIERRSVARPHAG
jgi:DNA-binding LacI/PurR family transcriptional regulator